MDSGGNFGGGAGWGENMNFCFSAQATELSQEMEVPNLQTWAELGETMRTSQSSISELVEAVRFQCVQEFRAVIPEVVDAVRSQCAQEFQAFIPIMVAEMKKTIHSSGLRPLLGQADCSAPRAMQLHFLGSLPETLYTLTKIRDAGVSLRVELRNSCGSRVESGPESSAKVRLVVLDGDFEVDNRADWTKEDFDKNVAKPRKEKGSLLKGNEIYLSKGVADVTDIVFTDNSKSMRNGTFRLGAVLVKGGAREAVSEKAFKVKERRLMMSYRRPLSLKDNPRCLKNIGDKITQRLASEEIHTVQDFLQLFHTDVNELRKILGISENQFSETIKIAESCPLSKEYYSYYDETEEVDLVLDCVFNIKGITFKGQTSQAYEVLDDSQKEFVNKLRGLAYKKRGKLQRTVDPMNQIPKQVEAIGPSSLQPEIIQYTGEQMVYKNSYVQQSFSYDDGYHRLMGNQMECSDMDQLIANLCASFASPLEESGTELKASTSPNDSSTAFTGDMQAAIHKTDELGTRCSRARWNSVRAVFSMITVKVSIEQGPRAAKRQRHG